MPALQTTNAKVLVTGVTGYIGAWAAFTLLERGYSVRGTVRDQSKAKELTQKFQKYGDKFELVTVKDLEEEGAFNEAVKGVQGILHIASPCNFDVKVPEEMINPAVKGTISIFKAAHEFGKEVKRIVLTSSFASITEPKTSPHVFTEADWNNVSSNLVKEKGKDSPSIEIYRASKVEAERSAWRFLEENKPHFDLAVINPVFVFGPFIHPVKDAESINLSVGLVFNSMKGGEINEDTAFHFVDVRDVAAAHVNALEKEEASGKRFITSGGQFGYGQVNKILKQHFPDSKTREPKNSELPDNKGVYASNEQATKILGIKWIGLEQTIVETAKDLQRFL